MTDMNQAVTMPLPTVNSVDYGTVVAVLKDNTPGQCSARRARQVR